MQRAVWGVCEVWVGEGVLFANYHHVIITLCSSSDFAIRTSVNRLVFPAPLGPINRNVGSSFDGAFR